MPPEELGNRITAIEQKVDAIHASIEKMRRFSMIMTIGSAAFILLPLFGLFFAIPSFLSTFSALNEFDAGAEDAALESELRQLLQEI